MEDYHVDRLGVEVQQCMKLTSTNSPIGLIVLIAYVHQRGQSRDDDALFVLTPRKRLRTARQTIGDGLPSCRVD